ncbi:MAG TPA: hypothetical protein VFR85_18525 [Anaeromyxobacteraceae bacterium]|nr:hypothetical protein [Anaeromyxobacteraceae bacterium]
MRPSRIVLPAALALAAGCSSPARIALDPPSAQLFGRGQAVKVHAQAFARNGRLLPDAVCRWSSSDEKVVSVKGPHNEATVTAVAPGRAVVRCQMGSLSAEVNVSVRYVARVEVTPARVEVKMLDRREPTALDVRAFDQDGAPVPGRVALTRCENEDVCRGDNRGQLWGVAPGESRVTVEVDEARAEVVARVVDARTAEGKPKRVQGNPMLDYEKAVKALGK